MNLFETFIFQNLTKEEIQDMNTLHFLRTASYEKNTLIFQTGDIVHEIGMVLSGSVNIESIDLWGNKSILSHVPEGHAFAETYALCHEPMMVDAITSEDSEIAFVNTDILLNEQHLGKTWYSKIMHNLLLIFAQKNLVLSNRIFCTSAKTIRERLFTYFSNLSVKNGSKTFQVPFDRQQMADYLNLDRSALSKELGKMRKEGLIDFHKNSFTLKTDSPLYSSE
ncbi:MAG: Crp/Fnr family transcriptional regulator [Lachnospiraceae bacterium]|mgnify:FL=1|nr:Crp/Fnr family transcriptional regulator [Lachnospiraceae bacterium]